MCLIMKIACITVLMQAMCVSGYFPYSLQSSSQSTVLLFTRAGPLPAPP